MKTRIGNMTSSPIKVHRELMMVCGIQTNAARMAGQCMKAKRSVCGGGCLLGGGVARLHKTAIFRVFHPICFACFAISASSIPPRSLSSVDDSDAIQFQTRSQWAPGKASGRPAKAHDNPLRPASIEASIASKTSSEAGDVSCLHVEMGEAQGFLGRKVSWIYIPGAPCEWFQSAGSMTLDVGC